ncbi:MAG: hypothetical protein E6R04_02910 [Spirochaetes bacterium]|nr:MAG: hypothetical protein E6R04_02910 [Spirochaetota bacterium]
MPRSFNAAEYDLDDAQLDSIFAERIVPSIFGASSPSSAPVGILIGAQPGAGKTQAGSRAIAESGQHVAAILGDDLRVFHPQYRRLLSLNPSDMPDATAQASSAWIRRAITYAARNRFNTLVEGTFRDPKVSLDTAQEFFDAGFRVESHLVAVSPELSHVGIGKRFIDDERENGAARFTSVSAHDGAFSALPATIRALSSVNSPVQRFVVRSRDEVLFDRERSEGHSIRGASNTAQREWNRVLSDTEFSVWREQAAEVSVALMKRHSTDQDVVNLVRQLDFDLTYLKLARSGEIAVRGHIRAGGDVVPHVRSSPHRR